MTADGYSVPAAVWSTNSGIKVDPHDPAFNLRDVGGVPASADPGLPVIYLFSNALDGDGAAYSMAEDGTVLGSHFCSHWGYMRHDLHDRADRKVACEAHYPGGYRLVVLTDPGSLPPPEVLERNRAAGPRRRWCSVTAPKWLTVGATVAELTSGSRMYRATFTTVERFTATQVVLANGNRYRLGGGELRRHVHTTTYVLLPLNDPRVVSARITATVERASHDVEDLMRDWRNDPHPTEKPAEAAIERLQKAIALSERIAGGAL